MLFHYAKATDLNATVPETFERAQFTDRHTISDWAEDAMGWAVYNGLITGTDMGTLSPQGNATRAQSAAILMRFMPYPPSAATPNRKKPALPERQSPQQGQSLSIQSNYADFDFVFTYTSNATAANSTNPVIAS